MINEAYAIYSSLKNPLGFIVFKGTHSLYRMVMKLLLRRVPQEALKQVIWTTGWQLKLISSNSEKMMFESCSIRCLEECSLCRSCYFSWSSLMIIDYSNHRLSYFVYAWERSLQKELFSLTINIEKTHAAKLIKEFAMQAKCSFIRFGDS